MRTGTADLPLHGGRAPRWLFERMTLLAREMGLAILGEEGTHGLMRRVADPVWFQAFGCVLGFDWHSSGLTTTTCGALKGGLRDLSHETGLFIAGGKGKTSRKTPEEIEAACWTTGQEAAPLVRASRLSAKVDSAAVQDGFQVYHHSFFFATDGSWAVVQQGMNEGTGMARRYHWLPPERFDSDPHAAITGNASQPVLNLVASEAEANRSGAVSLAREKPITLLGEMTRMRTVAMPRHHEVRLSDLHPEGWPVSCCQLMSGSPRITPPCWPFLAWAPRRSGRWRSWRSSPTASPPRCAIRCRIRSRMEAKMARPIRWTAGPTTRPSSRCDAP